MENREKILSPFIKQFVLPVGFFMSLGCIGASYLGKSEHYIGDNPIYGRVECIEQALNQERVYQYNNIETLCTDLCNKKDLILNLTTERDSLKSLPDYAIQEKKVKRGRIKREIPYGTLMMIGLGGTIISLMSLGYEKKDPD